MWELIVLLATGYAWLFGITFSIYLLIYLIIKSLSQQSKLVYHLQIFFLYYTFTMVSLLILPVMMVRPKNVDNCRLVCWICRHLPSTHKVTWEIRKPEILSAPEGSVLVVNHQSEVDLLAKINVRELISRSTLIVKKELLYLFPFGQLSWLMGVEFVDRSNPSRASKTLSHCERLLTEKNIKIWVYPEGTRSYGKGIQQFKRGAFKIAIQAQAPVVPIVISPYHFLDYKQKQMGKGHAIISVLEPIPSKGWTMEQVDEFCELVRSAMMEEYEKLDKELHKMKQDPDWETTVRPRRKIIRKQ